MTLDKRKVFFTELSHLVYTSRPDVRGVHSGSRHPLIKLKHLRGNKAHRVRGLQEVNIKNIMYLTVSNLCLVFAIVQSPFKTETDWIIECEQAFNLRANWFCKSFCPDSPSKQLCQEKGSGTGLTQRKTHNRTFSTEYFTMNVSWGLEMHIKFLRNGLKISDSFGDIYTQVPVYWAQLGITNAV